MEPTDVILLAIENDGALAAEIVGLFEVLEEPVASDQASAWTPAAAARARARLHEIFTGTLSRVQRGELEVPGYRLYRNRPRRGTRRAARVLDRADRTPGVPECKLP